MPKRVTPAVLLVLAFAGSCRPAGEGAVVSIPPHRSWVEDLGRQRATRDDYFRQSPDSPLVREDIPEFRGLQYWEPDPAYYFVGSIQAYAEPQRFSIPTTAGGARPCERVGWVTFRVGGEVRRLNVYRLLDSDPAGGPPTLLLPFKDLTSGTETYGAGRYVDLTGPAGGPYVLDFNQAYNPSCAYGEPERFACPVTPPENRLDVRIEAGERGFKR